jgi:hypothetical protein
MHPAPLRRVIGIALALLASGSAAIITLAIVPHGPKPTPLTAIPPAEIIADMIMASGPIFLAWAAWMLLRPPLSRSVTAAAIEPADTIAPGHRSRRRSS